LKDIKIQKAVSMSSFSIAIDTKGVAYIWGTGGTTASVSYGSRVDTLPTVMESLRVSVPVVDLSCGLGHALFLVEGHKVYCWGNGGNGRLGLGNTQDRFEACPVLELEGVNIASICCGASHSMAVSDTGKLYCWGKNSAGQCSKAGGDDVLTPLLVTQLKDEFIKTVSSVYASFSS
jgi:alpha-tubulin suppressor-like RCC1 family protein